MVAGGVGWGVSDLLRLRGKQLRFGIPKVHSPVVLVTGKVPFVVGSPLSRKSIGKEREKKY